MTSHEAPAGRVVLMVGAYSPLFLVAGMRGWPHPAAVAACAAALVGLLAWALVVRKLWTAQPRDVTVEEASAVDGEVTAYIVSLLLPAVAADTPSGPEWGAYAVCACLILVVAWGAGLWSVNPIVYVLGLRVIRIQFNGETLVALAHDVPAVGDTVIATRAAGVVLVQATTDVQA